MDDQSAALASAFPPPPGFYHAYTAEATRALGNAALAQSEPLPPHLARLVPPPPPDAGTGPDDPPCTYRSLGHIWSTKDSLPTLSALGIPELFSNASSDEAGADPSYRVSELKQLTKSLLIKYLELVGVMGISPEQFPDRVEDIRIILINMHHLLNEYRPHQARESLIIMMEEQLERKQAQIETAKRACEHIESVLSSATAKSEMDSLEIKELYQVEYDGAKKIDSLLEKVQDSSGLDQAKERDLLIWSALAPKM
ncbi:MED7 protein-domain-containing protein [Lipomyces orientalis]|uniref:MED7 protein-domain-containing protein n=1 Tax=Lipomyces orientalis TaxID=1233043 RepID=A0ACC3TT00_9ASCO